MPTRDRPDSLPRVLARLAEQALDGFSAELVVVANGSAAESRRALEDSIARFPWTATVLHLDGGNTSIARNRAVEVAHADLLLFINDDVVPANDDFVAGHVAAHADGANRGVLGPVPWDPGRPINTVMRWLSDKGMSHSYAGWENGGGARPEAVYFNNFSMRRSPYEEIGGLDPRLGRYGWEEYDLMLRLLERGFDVSFEPKLLAYHDHYHSLQYSLERMRKQGRSAVVFNELHSGREGLMTPHPSPLKVAIGAAAAPVATRVPIPEALPDRIARPLLWFGHQCALAQGFRQARRTGLTPDV